MGAKRQTGKQTSRDGDKQASRQTGKQTNGQADKRASRQAGKRANRQAGILIRLLRKLSPSRVSLPFPSTSLFSRLHDSLALCGGLFRV